MLAIPDDLAIAQTRRPPIVLNKASGLVSAQPGGEVVELIVFRKNGGKAYDTSLSGVGRFRAAESEPRSGLRAR